MADAMRLVDRECPHARQPEQPLKPFGREPLGGDEKELVITSDNGRLHAVAVRGLEAAVEERRRDATGKEAVHLVFHERDERGDDECETLPHERGRLVAV